MYNRLHTVDGYSNASILSYARGYCTTTCTVCYCTVWRHRAIVPSVMRSWRERAAAQRKAIKMAANKETQRKVSEVAESEWDSVVYYEWDDYRLHYPVLLIILIHIDTLHMLAMSMMLVLQTRSFLLSFLRTNYYEYGSSSSSSLRCGAVCKRACIYNCLKG